MWLHFQQNLILASHPGARFLLFDSQHILHRSAGSEHVFTTQGHLITLLPSLRTNPFERSPALGKDTNVTKHNLKCLRRNRRLEFFHPIRQFGAIASSVGVSNLSMYPQNWTESDTTDFFVTSTKIHVGDQNGDEKNQRDVEDEIDDESDATDDDSDDNEEEGDEEEDNDFHIDLV